MCVCVRACVDPGMWVCVPWHVCVHGHPHACIDPEGFEFQGKRLPAWGISFKICLQVWHPCDLQRRRSHPGMTLGEKVEQFCPSIDRRIPPSIRHLFTRSALFVEHLLYARLCFRHLAGSVNDRDKSLPSWGLGLVVEDRQCSRGIMNKCDLVFARF